jgi:hypothetical protein
VNRVSDVFGENKEIGRLEQLDVDTTSGHLRRLKGGAQRVGYNQVIEESVLVDIDVDGGSLHDQIRHLDTANVDGAVRLCVELISVLTASHL